LAASSQFVVVVDPQFSHSPVSSLHVHESLLLAASSQFVVVVDPQFSHSPVLSLHVHASSVLAASSHFVVAVVSQFSHFPVSSLHVQLSFGFASLHSVFAGGHSHVPSDLQVQSGLGFSPVHAGVVWHSQTFVSSLHVHASLGFVASSQAEGCSELPLSSPHPEKARHVRISEIGKMRAGCFEFIIILSFLLNSGYQTIVCISCLLCNKYFFFVGGGSLPLRVYLLCKYDATPSAADCSGQFRHPCVSVFRLIGY
jgi:hypothetical protein